MRTASRPPVSPELERQLFEKYPDLYAYKSADGNSSDMTHYGFAHGDGWFDIIDSLSATITGIMRNDRSRNHLTPEEFAETRQVRVAQVKEKFGSLRFYVDNGSPEVCAAITMAEMMSSRTCEYCGNSGMRRGGGWVKVRCDACEAKRKNDV